MGILFGSGLVAGDALVAVISAFLISSWGGYRTFFDGHEGMMDSLTGSFGPWLALIAFGLLAVLFYSVARSYGSTGNSK